MDGCERPHAGRGFCGTHYKRWQKGLPLHVDRLAPVEERFWRFVVMGANGCWVWRARPNRHGYGFIQHDRRPVLAHRLSYKIHKGEVPPGLQIDHLCANRRCVNPDHLEAVTCAVNVQRAKARITHCPQGHEYSLDNTRIRVSGARACRTCQREQARARRLRVAA